ncbi:MAG: TlpA disulfide reductase family protein [Gemmatimonadota bacterium]
MRKKSSNLAYLIAAAGGLAVVIAAWLLRDNPAFRPIVGGSEAPAFTANTLDGQPRSLEDFGDKVVLLNIWATWCPPCIEELPSMQRLYEALQGEPFEIVAVSVDATLGQADPDGKIGGNVGEFVRSFGLTFPILHDPGGEIRYTYKTTALPESFLIRRDGIVHRKVSGGTEWDTPAWIEEIRRLMDEGD